MWPYPRIVAHRGGGTLAPENTIAALRCGVAYGFRAVEFDVMLSRDGVGVVIHDAEFGRTVKAHGSVPELDADQLAVLDAGSWFDAAFAGETIPLFTDFAAWCKQQRVWMNIEIKPAAGYERETGRWVALATRALFAAELAAVADSGAGTAAESGTGTGIDPATLPLLSSFSDVALAAARDAAPELPRACLFDRLPDNWREQAEALGAVAIHTSHKHLTPVLAQDVKSAGFGLFCYTVNQPDLGRELLAWGVDAFCTDRIDLIGPGFA